MGRNQQSVRIGDHQQEQRNEEGDHDRQPRNIRHDEGGFILRHGAGPGDERAGFHPAMVARVEITPGMEVKTAGDRLLEVEEAGVADEPRDETDTHEQARDQHDQA